MAGFRMLCLSLAATAVAGCSANHEFRVAYVGDEGRMKLADGDGAGAPAAVPAPAVPVIVAAGNGFVGRSTPLGGTVLGAPPLVGSNVLGGAVNVAGMSLNASGSTAGVSATIGTTATGRVAGVSLDGGSLLGSRMPGISPTSAVSAIVNATVPIQSTVSKVIHPIGGCC